MHPPDRGEARAATQFKVQLGAGVRPQRPDVGQEVAIVGVEGPHEVAVRHVLLAESARTGRAVLHGDPARDHVELPHGDIRGLDGHLQTVALAVELGQSQLVDGQVFELSEYGASGAIFVPYRPQGDGRPPRPTVGRAVRPDSRVRPHGAAKERLQLGGGQGRVDGEAGQGTADQVVGPHAQHAAQGRVHFQDGPLDVADVLGDGTVLEQPEIAFAQLTQPLGIVGAFARREPLAGPD